MPSLTGAIRVMSKEKVYQKLRLKSLRDRRCCSKLCLFYEFFQNEHLRYLFRLISTRHTLYSTRNMHNISLLTTNHNFFVKSFFLSTIIEWNSSDTGLRKSENFSVFKSNIFKFILPSPNSVYNRQKP